MDLGTIEQNIKDHKYTNLASFKRDIQQVSSQICIEVRGAHMQQSIFTFVFYESDC